MGLSPTLAFIGVIGFIVFYSGFLNLIKSNQFELLMMDAKSKTLYGFSKFVSLTLVNSISMAMIGNQFRMSNDWLMISIFILMFLIYACITIGDVIFDSFKKMPLKLATLIDVRKNIFLTITAIMLLVSDVIAGGYVYKLSENLPTEGDRIVFVVFAILVFSAMLSIWMQSVAKLLTYNTKTIKYRIDNKDFKVVKVLFNGKVQLESILGNEMRMLSIDKLEEYSFIID